ncbi:hypothetical protein TIFTF001_026175 [Ficus carica]|uniref:Uncharacterized protein n=1 Tax=Ficus carica TaxID=3494 RepID=A0AA88DKR3_FICCA|nr:hypothetical protein TIFTF001_026175 [Ficus carica]
MGHIPSDPSGSVVLAHEASTVSVRLGGRGWRRSRDNDRYRMLGVRGCRVVGVARPAIVRLSVGTEWHDRGSLDRPSRKGHSGGWGSIARASILKPNGDLLEVPKGEAKELTDSYTPHSPVSGVLQHGNDYSINKTYAIEILTIKPLKDLIKI